MIQFGEFGAEVRGEDVYLARGDDVIALISRVRFKEDFKGWRILLWPLGWWLNKKQSEMVLKSTLRYMNTSINHAALMNRRERKRQEEYKAQEACNHRYPTEWAAGGENWNSYRCTNCGEVLYSEYK